MSLPLHCAIKLWCNCLNSAYLILKREATCSHWGHYCDVSQYWYINLSMNTATGGGGGGGSNSIAALRLEISGLPRKGKPNFCSDRKETGNEL